MGTGSFPGVKWTGRGVDHPPTSSAEVEGRVELYICSPSGPSWSVLRRTLLDGESSVSRGGPFSLGKSAGYPLGRKLGEPYSRPGCFGREKTSCPRREGDQAIQYIEAHN